MKGEEDREKGTEGKGRIIRSRNRGKEEEMKIEKNNGAREAAGLGRSTGG